MLESTPGKKCDLGEEEMILVERGSKGGKEDRI
jgi:hypothetical protein